MLQESRRGRRWSRRSNQKLLLGGRHESIIFGPTHFILVGHKKQNTFTARDGQQWKRRWKWKMKMKKNGSIFIQQGEAARTRALATLKGGGGERERGGWLVVLGLW